MYALIAVFTLPEDTDWDVQHEIARQRAALYTDVPGLRAKAFVIDPERRLYGGHYIWESAEALERFLASDLFAGAKQKFGEPRIEICEVAAYVSEGAVASPR